MHFKPFLHSTKDFKDVPFFSAEYKHNLTGRSIEDELLVGEISGSHSDEYEDGCLLSCSAVQSGGSIRTF
jgi:hypothetical protein